MSASTSSPRLHQQEHSSSHRAGGNMEVEAIEEAFIRGEWEIVREQSKQKLVECGAARSNDASTGAFTQSQDALVSMYLQALFELGMHDEVEEASELIHMFAPLPFPTSLQWAKFLIAMSQESMALDYLNDLLEKLAPDADASDELRARYAQVTQILIFHLMLPTESTSTIHSYITRDSTLDEATKQRFLQALEKASSAERSQEMQPSVSMPASSPPHGTSQTTSTPTTAGATRHSGSSGASDASSDLFAIGGTALAVAAVAIGVFRYRDQLRETVADVGAAVSKGLADAKYALFES